jgi:hypothetical protein
VGYWRRLHNIYASPNIIKVIKSRRMRWVGYAAHRDMRNAYRICIGKPERKMPFERPRYRWKDNMRMEVREIGWEGVDWIHVA